MHLARRARSLSAAAFLCLLSALLACATASGPAASPDPTGAAPSREGDLPVLTDSAVYHLQREPSAYRAWVRAAYVNRTGAPVAFARCTRDATGPIFFVHRAGSDSTRPMFSDWGWACVGGVPTGALAPGDSLVVRVPLGTLDQPRMQPRLEAAWLTGQFRVALELCAPPVAGSDECRRLPLAARASKSFEVRFAPGVEPP